MGTWTGMGEGFGFVRSSGEASVAFVGEAVGEAVGETLGDDVVGAESADDDGAALGGVGIVGAAEGEGEVRAVGAPAPRHAGEAVLLVDGLAVGFSRQTADVVPLS